MGKFRVAAIAMIAVMALSASAFSQCSSVLSTCNQALQIRSAPVVLQQHAQPVIIQQAPAVAQVLQVHQAPAVVLQQAHPVILQQRVQQVRVQQVRHRQAVQVLNVGHGAQVLQVRGRARVQALPRISNAIQSLRGF